MKPNAENNGRINPPGHAPTASGGMIDLHVLPPVAAINGARIRELTGDDTIPDTTQVILRTYRAVVGDRTFHFGFCLGSDAGFSAIGIAVIDRLMMEAPGTPLHVVPVVHEEIAWDIVLRHLRSFTGQVLLFAFPDSDVYDAGTAEVYYSKHVRQYHANGARIGRLTADNARGYVSRRLRTLTVRHRPSSMRRPLWHRKIRHGFSASPHLLER